MDVDFFIGIIYNEVNFFLHICTAGTVDHNTNINGISST